MTVRISLERSQPQESQSCRGLSKAGEEPSTWGNEGARLAQCLKGEADKNM